MTDSNDTPLCAVREIEPCMFCRFYRDNEIVIDILFRLVYSTILTTLFFTIIAVTTTITAVKLRRVIQWRHSSTSSASVSVTSSIKEIALTKTLVATSVLFIVCLAPSIMVQMASFAEPEFYFTGRYYNLVNVTLYRHVAFPCLQLFLQFLHLSQHEHPVPPDVTRHFPAVFTQEAGE